MDSVFFRTGKRSGAWNMAVDRLLMDRVRTGDWELTLRVYGWDPACLSLGRFQDASRELDLVSLLNDGYHAVRRPTGGRAVWHEREVTYSVVAREDHPLVSGGTAEALRKVSEPMLAAMRSLGIEVTAGRSEVHRVSGPGSTANPCFTSHGMWEIGTPDGRKLVGSAQARSRGVFLEHGSILLANDQSRVLDYLPGHQDSARRRELLERHLARGIATVGELAPGVSRRQVEDAIHTRFQKTLGVPLAEKSPDVLRGSELDELVTEFMHV